MKNLNQLIFGFKILKSVTSTTAEEMTKASIKFTKTMQKINKIKKASN